MSDVEIKFEEQKLKNIQRQLRDIPNAMPKVISRAINRTATSARVEIARRIAGKVDIKESAVKSSILKTKATYRFWQAVLIIDRKRRIPLKQFGARKTKTGVSYGILKSGGRKTIKSAFIATMKGGHKGVFRVKKESSKLRYEKRKKGGKTYWSQLPILELRGPSLGEVFEGGNKGLTNIAKEVTGSVYKNLEKNIDSQLKFILSKWRAAG